MPDPTPEPDLADMYQQLKDLPCSVDRVYVTPPDLQTRLLLILREFKEAKEATTLDEVARRTQKAVECLQELGVFNAVDASLRPGGSVRSDEDVDVHIICGSIRSWPAFSKGPAHRRKRVCRCRVQPRSAT